MLAAGVVLLFMLIPGSAIAAPSTVYTQDFSSPLGPEWSGGVDSIITPNGSTVLGAGGQPLANNAAVLTLTGLPAHQQFTLTFDLFALRSLDGGEPWDVDASGVAGDIQAPTSFSNAFNQCYPHACGSADQAPQTGAAEVGDLLGYGPCCGGSFGDASRYHMVYSGVAHNDGTLTITITDSDSQGWDDEGFAIDSLSVVTDTDAPGPPAAANYTVQSGSHSGIPTGTDDIGIHCDDCAATIPLPFPVTFYETQYTQAYVNSNGVLTFPTATYPYYTNTALPTSDFGPSIFAHWDDLLTYANGGDTHGVRTATTGTPGSRDFVIEWDAYYIYGGGDTHFSIVLHEDSSDVDVYYGPSGNSGMDATAGVQEDQDRYTQYSFASPVLTDGLRLTYTFNGTACTITGTAGNDRIRGTSGDDVMCGLGGDDFLDGRGGNDTIIGGDGNDTVVGRAGNDTLEGDAGVDLLLPGSGNDTADGGDGGRDRALFSDIQGGGVDVMLASGSVTGEAGSNVGSDTLSNIEQVFGSTFDDILVAQIAGTASMLKGGAGNDQLDVDDGDGLDTVVGNQGTDTCTISAGDRARECETGPSA
jgi:Ca2+-binding RTX toxin-like protein